MLVAPDYGFISTHVDSYITFTGARLHRASRIREDRVWFGIMNEPYNLPSLSSWKDVVQAAVTAIRKAGAAKR